MATPQIGILVSSAPPFQIHTEYDLAGGHSVTEALVALAGLPADDGTVTTVIGVRPSLWAGVGELPRDAADFDQPVVGLDGFTMAATQHDVIVWVEGPKPDVVFDRSMSAARALAGLASVGHELSGWAYHVDHDLTGFEDGTENPTDEAAVHAVVIPEGEPGQGGTQLLIQQWRHEATWLNQSSHHQEEIIGRTLKGSVELDPRPENSHVARTDQDDFGHILRRNIPYGTPSDHGTIFVGFCASRAPLHTMLESMAGVDGGIRDALTHFAEAITGAYYVIPSIEQLEQVSRVQHAS